MADADRPQHRTRRRWPWRRWFGKLLAFAALFALGWRLLMAQSPERATQPAVAGTKPVQQHDPTTAFEPTDVPVGPIALVYAGTLVVLVISCFALMAAYPDTLPDVSRTLRISPPGPRLQTDPQADLARFRAQEEKQLDTYYWVDKQKGVVHIPVEQAMKKLAKSGVPGFPQGQQ